MRTIVVKAATALNFLSMATPITLIKYKHILTLHTNEFIPAFKHHFNAKGFNTEETLIFYKLPREYAESKLRL